MLDTVKMHPLLVTASKDKETTTERWKKMEAHDVVVECERFSLDVAERCQHESCYLTSSFRSRSGTTNSTTYAESSNQFSSIKSTSIASLAYDAKDFFSPSNKLYPKTPPVQDSNVLTSMVHLQNVGQSIITNMGRLSQEGTSPPEAAIEATPDTTPIKDIRCSRNQVPSSVTAVRALSNLNAKNWSIGSTTSTPSHSQPSSPMRKDISPFSFPAELRSSAFGIPKKEPYSMKKIQRLVQDRAHATEGDASGSRPLTPTVHPTSPLRIIQANECSNLLSSMQRIESPVSKEDEEVLEIVRLGEIDGNFDLRQCDSVLQEGDGGRGTEVDLEECEQEHGSPCTAGGLHMPNSRSMNDFAKRVRRLRYHSQCATEPEVAEISTGSSPGNCMPFLSNTVRRANSCPEMKKEIKKSPLVPKKDNTNKTLVEADEELIKDGDCKHTQKELSTIETQTENFWPMPYEHLFLGIFPSLDNSDIKPSPAPSPAPSNVQDKFQTVSPYEILDKYIDIAVHVNERDPIKNLRDQLYLLQQQLLFEKHRRERDQVQLQQKDIDNLKDQLENLKLELHHKLRHGLESIHMWENKCLSLLQECKQLHQQNENLKKDFEDAKLKYAYLDKQWQQSNSALLDAEGEVKIAKEQAWAGENIRAELENMSKQLLLSGEIQHRYQEKLSQLPMLQRYEKEFLRTTDTYVSEIKNLQQLLEGKTSLLEASKARTLELEQLLSRSDESTARQKRLLSEVAEEYEEKLKALESKYQTQLTISRFNDERILELWQRIELLTRHPVHSPDTSSCHEVHATMTDKTSIATGLSPHSSPLSASLASSEGSIAFGHSDMKNLQNLVDQKEPLSPSCKISEELEANILVDSIPTNCIQLAKEQIIKYSDPKYNINDLKTGDCETMLLNQTIYYLNKSKSKWISVGLYYPFEFASVVKIFGRSKQYVIFKKEEWIQFHEQRENINKYFQTFDTMWKPRQIGSKTLTFEMIEEKKILKIENMSGNEVYLGWESVSEVWSLESVLRYRLSYSSGSNFKYFYEDVIRAVAEMSGDVKINIYNIINRLSEKSDDVCCMLEVLLFMPDYLMYNLKDVFKNKKYSLLKKMWMLYAQEHWTKSYDLKSAVERLYEELGALEFDADHEAIYGMERYYTVQQCEELRDKYKIGRKVCRKFLQGKTCFQCLVKRISEIGLRHFLDTVNKYIKDCSDSSSSDEEVFKAVEQNGEETTEKEE
ncbi:hypothetical protein FQA39_LY18452 [Lamprigera yunnana]|nr:hypothetical protein FQA39_LY18452 [Lamprigera yunnana]